MGTQDNIYRNMTIEEIFQKFPGHSQKLAQEMTNAGLHCAGCGAATWETLEAGMYGHGFTDEEIDQLIGKLNDIVAQPLNLGSITLTKRAAEKFKEILIAEKKEGWALRFGDKPGGCGGYEYILDFSEKPQENDEVFHSHGVAIHVNKQRLEYLLGSEIDYQDGLSGAGFKIINPNAKGSCSCGSSQNY